MYYLWYEMKKSVAILLLVLYIISSSGVAIRAHYCCGKLKSINLVLDSSPDKDCMMAKKSAKNCCKDKIANNTLVIDQKASPVVISISDHSFKDVLTCVSIVSHGFFQAYDDADSVPECTSPPTAQRDVYLKVRVMRV